MWATAADQSYSLAFNSWCFICDSVRAALVQGPLPAWSIPSSLLTAAWRFSSSHAATSRAWWLTLSPSLLLPRQLLCTQYVAVFRGLYSCLHYFSINVETTDVVCLAKSSRRHGSVSAKHKRLWFVATANMGLNVDRCGLWVICTKVFPVSI